MASLLTVKDLQVEFHTRDGVVKAVNGVTFSLERGKVLALLGNQAQGRASPCARWSGSCPRPGRAWQGRSRSKGRACMPSQRGGAKPAR